MNTLARVANEVNHPQEEESTMSNDTSTKKGLTKTAEMFKESYTEAGKMAGSVEAHDQIVALVKKFAGDAYPDFFKTPLGQMLEPVLVCGAVHFAGSNTDVPYGKQAASIAEYAMQGKAYEQIRPLLKDLGLIFKQISVLGGSEPESKE